MTTAHRPTFDPARGKEAARGEAYHQRLLPAHKTLKFRQQTQGAPNEQAKRDLKAELLRKERAHYARKEGRALPEDEDDEEEQAERKAIEVGSEEAAGGVKRKLSDTGGEDQAEGDPEEDYEAKKRRVLEETKDIDADSSSSSESESEDDSSEDEDDEANLKRELAKIKAERADAAAKQAAAQAAKDEEVREKEIAYGNPLLNGKQEYGVKRRWDDDVVFKNQARGQGEREKEGGKRFVNDLLRSDFHRRFMDKLQTSSRPRAHHSATLANDAITTSRTTTTGPAAAPTDDLFARLPREIRDYIYKLAYTEGIDLIQIVSSFDAGDEDILTRCSSEITRLASQLGQLNVSHVTHPETKPRFNARSHRLPRGIPIDMTAFFVSKQWLDEAFPLFIRHVHVDFANERDVYGLIAAHPSIRGNITKITFSYHLEATSPPRIADLLNSCPTLTEMTLRWNGAGGLSWPVPLMSFAAFAEVGKVRGLKKFRVHIEGLAMGDEVEGILRELVCKPKEVATNQ